MAMNTVRLLAAALLVEIIPASAFAPHVRHEGRVWTPARATDAVAAAQALAEDGLSPAPTAAPGQPEFAGMELFKRQFTMGTDTCGFAAEYKSEPWTCFRVGASCVTTGTNLVCCAGPEPDCYSTVLTTCQNFRTSVSSCGSNTLCCPSSSPSCWVWQFSTTKSPGSTYSLFNCYATGGTGLLVATPPALTGSTGSSTGRTSRTNLNPSTSSSTDGGPTTTSAGPVETTTAPPSDGGSSSSNIGAIVGGAVGGVAVIAMAGVMIFWLVSRNRRAKAADAASRPSALNNPGAVPSIPPTSPGQQTLAPSTVLNSPQMSQHQQGGYFMGAGVLPGQQQQQQVSPGGYSNAAAGYYDPKQQPSPVYPTSDPRMGVMQPQHTGTTTVSAGDINGGGSPWQQTGQYAPPPSMSPAPTELANHNPVGTQGNRAELD